MKDELSKQWQKDIISRGNYDMDNMSISHTQCNQRRGNLDE